MTTDRGEYWSIDIPGMSEEQALALQERLAPEFDFGVIVVSPRTFMTRGFDRSTVEFLKHCLGAAQTAGGMSPADTAGTRSLLEDFDSWLAQAGPDVDD